MEKESFSRKYSSIEPEAIRQMFAKVAPRYDLANSILSLGIHHFWRRALVRDSQVRPGDHVLDCATGTGDLAIAFKRVVGDQGLVVGTDFCEEMLRVAPWKARTKRLVVSFEKADVMDLRYPDCMFDVVSISFGIRNVPNPTKALGEMLRVTKPGGRVMVLEFGQTNISLFAKVYQFYSVKILPVLGGLITGQKEAYEYLQRSSSTFPCREDFLGLMKEAESDSAGYFADLSLKSLTGGLVYLYRGIKK